MGMPPNELDTAQGAPARQGALATAMNYWIKEPQYMARWTYFHRPGVWNAMGGPKGFQWHGLYGFKTLGAGGGGIGYTGGPRSVAPGMKWILRGGGAGLEAIGKGFQRAGVATGRRSIGGVGARVTYFGGGFRTGGLAGGIANATTSDRGLAMSRRVAGIFGGANTNFGRLRMPGITDDMLLGLARSQGSDVVSQSMRAAAGGLDEALSRGVNRVGVGALFRPTARAASVVGGLTAEQQAAYMLTGQAGRRALGRSVMFKGGTQLMKAGTVAMNIALFGGTLANMAYTGTRALGEQALRMRMDRSAQQLEFGSGIDPFQSRGAMTERQRAVQAIQSSQINGRSYLGNEAALMADRRY